MKFKKLLYGVAICTASSLFWVSCKKTDTATLINPLSPQTNLRVSGVVPDDPERVAKVPMIISTTFLNQSEKALLADPLSLGVTSDKLNLTLASRRPNNDRTFPTVSITSPTNGSTVSGTVTIQVSASDNVGVSSVKINIDGVLKSTSSIAPYSYSWNTTGVASGTHTISATAQDAAGNISSSSIQVGINAAPSGDATAPVVSITSPASGSAVTVGATISVGVSATDNVGVSLVSFSVDAVLKSSSSSAPYNFSWNTTGAASGTHTLTATAKDAAGNTSSFSIPVTVNAVIIPPPTTLPTSVLLAMPPVGYQGPEGSCIPFAVAYAARSCEQYYRSNAGSYSQSTNILSPEFLFNQIQTGCSGSSILDALDFVVNKGVCTWTSMPYDYNNGCTLQPNASQNTEAGNYKITSYSSIYTADITAMKTKLANKHPLAILVANDNNFNNAGPGYVWKSYDTSGPYGAHAITICGYDDAMHAYKAINSWGTAWGSAGYIWIDYDFLPLVKSNCYVMN